MGYGFKGQKEYEKFKNGEKLSYKGAVLAHCYECMGFYQDGKQDCLGKSCPLYQFYPYRPEKRTHSAQNLTQDESKSKGEEKPFNIGFYIDQAGT